MIFNVLKALKFAARAHGDQKRKYTGEPYVVHLIEVAELVAEADTDGRVVIAALLHDVLEDTAVTYEDLKAEFGVPIAWLVRQLTDVSKLEDGNRAERKKIDLAHLSQALAEAQTIKYADLISNSRSITKHDPGFARVYMREKAAILRVLTLGNAKLREQALKLVLEYFENEPETTN